jgi:hypothetical protein
MVFSTEQHLAAAKLVRMNGMEHTGLDRKRFIEMSNSFVVCARLAAEGRGGICLDSFDWSSAIPEWAAVETQIGQLSPLVVDAPPLVPDLPSD